MHHSSKSGGTPVEDSAPVPMESEEEVEVVASCGGGDGDDGGDDDCHRRSPQHLGRRAVAPPTLYPQISVLRLAWPSGPEAPTWLSPTRPHFFSVG